MANRHPLYLTWSAMKQRCQNPNAHGYWNYGARGITVCERWQQFKPFAEDMGDRPSPKHSLDRIDNDKGYSKENCRWVTYQEQMSNKRNSVKVSAFGETHTLAEWARKTGLSEGCLVKRLRNKKQDISIALSKPARSLKQRPVVKKKDGVVVAKYSSLAEAEKIEKINRSGMCNVLNGSRRSLHGFTWEYAD